MEATAVELDQRVGVLAAQIHALSAELVDVLAEVARAESWAGHGFRTFAHWLSVRSGFVPSEARRLTRLATRAHRIPSLLDDARQGAVSAGMCDVAARLSTPENEDAVAEVVRLCTPSQAIRVLGQYRRLDPPGTRPADDSADGAADPVVDPFAEAVDEAQRDAEERAAEREEYWSAGFDEDGMYAGSFRLGAVRGELLRQAIEAMRKAGERDRPPPSATGDRPADLRESRPRVGSLEAIERMATTAIDVAEAAGARAPAGERFVVQVTIDVAVLARIAGIALDPMVPPAVRLGDRCHIVGGPPLTDAEVAAILCDAQVQVLVEDRGVPLWLGNEVRTATRQQRRALRTRSGGCEFPGCRHTRFVQAHHVVFSSRNGSSGLDNFVLLCPYHHHRLHDGLFTVRALGRQRFEYHDKWGRHIGPPPPLELVPEPAPPPDIDPDTPRSVGRGEPLTDFGLDVLLHGLLSLTTHRQRAGPAAA